MAFKIFGRKKNPETAENYSFPIEERARPRYRRAVRERNCWRRRSAAAV